MNDEALGLFLGTGSGILIGLIPGIHSNTIAAFAAAASASNNTPIAVFIVALGISHSIANTIPSIILGVSQEDTNLLPGQRMLLEGHANLAIKLSILGAILGILGGALFTPVFYSLAKNYSSLFPHIIPAVIFAAIAIVVAGSKNKITALFIALASGAVGIIMLNSGVVEIVFALISGFFAIPSLIGAILSKPKIPPQINTDGSVNAKFGLLVAIVAGILSIMPGLGPSNSAVLVNSFVKKLQNTEYLVLTGGIETTNLFFTILMLYALGKTRSGIAISLENLAEKDMAIMALLLCAAITSAGIAAFICLKFSKIAIDTFAKLDYRKISGLVLALLFLLIYFFSGPSGIASALIASAIGYTANANKINRSLCMSFLLAPTMLFYLGISL